MLEFRDIGPILISTLLVGIGGSVLYVITSHDHLQALLVIAGGIAGLVLVLALLWLKCEIQDRLHARSCVRQFDAFVESQERTMRVLMDIKRRRAQ